MGAKKARIKRNECGSKQRYDDQLSAYTAGRIITKRKGEKHAKVSAYRCAFCGKWHWGNKRKKRL